MLLKRDVEKIREHLEKAQNPLYYFDNDQDGLSSYLLLRRAYKKGNGVPVKTSPLGKEYLRRIDEFNPDYIFILDQPTVSQEFFDEVLKRNLPVVWIDHHENDFEKIPSWVEYINPVKDSRKGVPVTRICYEVSKRKEDLWILIAGCVADKFLPKDYKLFLEEYPDLAIDSKEPFKILYGSGIGRVSRMIGTGLKDRTSLVMKMIRFLLNVRTPYEVLEEKSENLSIHKRFNAIETKQKNLVERAKANSSGKLIFFKYGGATSMSADISNRLSYEFPEKFIVVAFLKGSRVNLSIRGKDARNIVGEAVKGIPLATFGGHEEAVGAQMNEDQLEEFEENLENLLK